MMVFEDVRALALARAEGCREAIRAGQKRILPTVDFVLDGKRDGFRARLDSLRLGYAEFAAPKSAPVDTAVVCVPMPCDPSFLLDLFGRLDEKFGTMLAFLRASAPAELSREPDESIFRVFLKLQNWCEKDFAAEIIRRLAVRLEAYALVKVDEAYWVKHSGRTRAEADAEREASGGEVRTMKGREEGILVMFETRTAGGFIRIPFRRARPDDEESPIVDFGATVVVDSPLTEGRYSHLLAAGVQ